MQTSLAVNLDAYRLRDRLMTLVQEMLGPAAQVPHPLPVDRQLNELGLNSLAMVNLVLAVEIEFDILIPQTEITPENFRSIATMQALLTRILKP